MNPWVKESIQLFREKTFLTQGELGKILKLERVHTSSLFTKLHRWDLITPVGFRNTGKRGSKPLIWMWKDHKNA